jgi:hypothetical protein
LVAKLPALAGLDGLLVTQIDPGVVVEVDDSAFTDTLGEHLPGIERGDPVRGKDDTRGFT